MVHAILELGGMSFGDVEDACSCSPVQGAILVSEGRDSSLYVAQEYREVSTSDFSTVDRDKLAASRDHVVC